MKQMEFKIEEEDELRPISLAPATEMEIVDLIAQILVSIIQKNREEKVDDRSSENHK